MSLISEGYSYNDIAILYRSNATSWSFEEEFITNNIPFVIYGGISIFQRAIIKDLIAYLNIIINPHNSFYLERIINVPSRKIGKITLTKIQDRAQESGTSVFDILPLYSKKAGKLYEFYNIIKDLQKDLESSHDLGDFIKTVGKKSGLHNHLVSLGEEGDDQLKFLAQVGNFFKFQESQHEGNQKEKVKNILDDLSLLQNSETKNNDGNNVILSTIHQVKGLEFKVVFLVSLEDGNFPIDAYDTDILEERRICYVALTRAKSELFLSYAKIRYKFGETKYYLPSIFISEMGYKNTFSNTQRLSNNTQNIYYDVKKDIVKPNNISNIEDPRVYDKIKVGDRIDHFVFKEGLVIDVVSDNINVSFNDGTTKTLKYPHPAIKILK